MIRASEAESVDAASYPQRTPHVHMVRLQSMEPRRSEAESVDAAAYPQRTPHLHMVRLQSMEPRRRFLQALQVVYLQEEATETAVATLLVLLA